jgi:hypothetical protein
MGERSSRPRKEPLSTVYEITRYPLELRKLDRNEERADRRFDLWELFAGDELIYEHNHSHRADEPELAPIEALYAVLAGIRDRMPADRGVIGPRIGG